MNHQKISTIIGVAICLLASLGLPSSGEGMGSNEPDACRKRIVSDYLRPLNGLPAAHPPPANGRLRGAPRRVHLYPVMDGLIQVGGNSFGYAFSVEGLLREWRPGWIVRSQLARVAMNGREGQVLEAQQRTLGRIRSVKMLNFSLPLRFGTGIYRYRLEIESGDSKRIAVYDQYVRVVPRHFNAGVWLNAEHYRPGAELFSQVRNFGTLQVTFGEDIQVEVFNGSTWVQADFQSPSRRNKRLAVLLAGQASSCSALTIPLAAPPGRYRIHKSILTQYARAARQRYVGFEIG